MEQGSVQDGTVLSSYADITCNNENCSNLLNTNISDVAVVAVQKEQQLEEENIVQNNENGSDLSANEAGATSVDELLSAVLEQTALPSSGISPTKDSKLDADPAPAEVLPMATGNLSDELSQPTPVPPQSEVQQHLPLQSKNISASEPASPSTLTMRYTDLKEMQDNSVLAHVHCLAQQENQRKQFEQQLDALRAALGQKDNMIALYQRENAILEKEKQAFRKEKEVANKEKESTVIKFAMKEKLLIDAKKEKEIVEKQLADAKKEIKNVSTRFQAVNEEKSRITYMIDDKCNEVRKYQRECEKLKSEIGQLESRLKYHVNKLNIEVEAKTALEKKLEEERNAPNKLEEKANEKLKVEYEANSILLKHEITSKTTTLEQLTKENQKLNEAVKQLQQQLNETNMLNTELTEELDELREEHDSVENAYSEEILNSAKLRGQLEELQVLRTQNMLNEETIGNLCTQVKELEATMGDNAQVLHELHNKERELLSINREMSESIVEMQNEVCLLKSKAQGTEAENKLLKQEKLTYDNKYEALEKQLSVECAEKNEERQLLARHLSEKTKLYEMTKVKLENVLGDFEAIKHKHATLVKELQREIQKYKKGIEQPHSATLKVNYCSKCESAMNGYNHSGPPTSTISHNSQLGSEEHCPGQQRSHSRTSSHGSAHSGSRRASEISESETMASGTTALQTDISEGPSKKVLVERILRLQQASARQTEKIDFLENHTLSLVAELQKKSKVVQYYMLRDQTAGALTSSKSDQNKSELAKYGNGVMAAIYGGVKSETKGMTLDLSLEINKKLQAVLEDTLLKNITLKENLDVLGLEVDNLTRKLRYLEAAK